MLQRRAQLCSQVCTDFVRCSVCSGGKLRRPDLCVAGELCRPDMCIAGELRRPELRCSELCRPCSSQVLRHGLREEVLQSRSLQGGSLDI